MLDRFNVATFEDLAEYMRDSMLEGFDEENVSRLCRCLKSFFDQPKLPHGLLVAHNAAQATAAYKRATGMEISLEPLPSPTRLTIFQVVDPTGPKPSPEEGPPGRK